MNWFQNLFQKKIKSRLGIDLGSGAIKLVEVLPEEKKRKLETYGLAYFSAEGLKLDMSQSKPFKEIYNDESEQEGEKIFQQGPAKGSIFDVLSNKEIGGIIRELCGRAKTKSSMAYFSLPVFTTFSTIIELPDMPSNELAAAIPFEARKYIPIPLEEVELDWMRVEPKTELPIKNPQGEKIDLENSGQIPEKKNQIVLVAILKEAIEKYLNIAKAAGLGVLALEPESFSLARVLAKNSSEIFVLVDVGSSFADIILIDQGMVKMARNDKKRIESKDQQLDKNILSKRIKESINLYQSKEKGVEQRKIKCVLTGGGALTPDLPDFLSKELNCEVIIGNPFSGLEYPGALEPALKEIGPALSVAVGLAMRE